MNNNQSDRFVLLPLILVVSLFFLWGVANNLNDILMSRSCDIYGERTNEGVLRHGGGGS